MKILLSTALLFTLAGSAHAAWRDRVALIDATLNRAIAADTATGKRLAEEAYFVDFEGEPLNMEVAVRTRISGKRCYELESQFSQLRQAINKPKSVDEPPRLRAALVADLNAAADELDATAPMTAESSTQLTSQFTMADTFGKSLVIILREGFEIILILGAISAFLIKAGARGQLRVVVSGALIGVLASILTAVAGVLFVRSININPEIIEGATLMLATIVLFFVSHWLISKAESKHWIEFIKSKVRVSLNTGNMAALWLTSFLAVYREGAETVLFYQGLASSAAGQANIILAGFLAGCVALGAVFVTFRQGILRIPPRPFFRITSALLYYMAFVFAGKAIVELQAGQVIHVIPLRGWPTVDFLGIYPNVQSLSAQAFLLGAMALSILIVMLRRRTAATPVSAA
jgi:high-affinity iron transporter